MSGADKVRNVAEKAKGHAKEAVGKVVGDRPTAAEGKADKVSADVKQAGEKVKDAFKD
ncbi:CsbD family protein [Kitasatospora sp. HPMI-4]|uniref:CsbD family protein n=1 Tax=Kitasatospora sp. HPMI-4 TaxID=3448443 RepID=UPI003F1C45F1